MKTYRFRLRDQGWPGKQLTSSAGKEKEEDRRTSSGWTEAKTGSHMGSR
jgi:hypothetical protein